MARRRSSRGWIALAVVAVAVAGGLWWWFRWREPAKPADSYRTELVSRGDVTMTVTATGTISAVKTVLVGSQVSGIIAALHADYNSPVRKGQRLAELDPTPFQATVAQRQADLEQAVVQQRQSELAFRRQERMLADELTPQSDYDDAKAAQDAARARVEQARAALDQAKTNLAYTRIVSPIDGVVVERQYDIGQTVAASFQAPTLFTIAEDLKRMQVQADVDQSDIGRIEVGQEARFTVDAYPGEEFRGRITQIRLNATVNQNVVTYPVILEVPNPEEKLRPKMTADVTIDVATVHDVLRVASAALRFRPVQASGSGNETSDRGAAGGGGSRGSSWGGGERPGHGSSGTNGGRAAGPTDGVTERREGGGSGTGPGSGTDGRMTAPGPGSSTSAPASGTAEPTPPSGAGPSGPTGGPAGGIAATRDMLATATGAPMGKRAQTVYRLGGNGKPEAVEVRTGISDGRYTQIVDGTLQPGDKLIVGLATAKADTSAQPFGGPSSGGRRMF